jgi:hypothetical protein
MHKIVTLFFIFCSTTYFLINDAYAENSEEQSIEITDTDAFYAGEEIVPLTKEMSEEEQAGANSYVLSSQPLPELDCSSPKLKKQVEDFIFKDLNKEGTNSVIEKRARILSVRNLSHFIDVSDEKIDADKDFLAAASLAYLKINRQREIYKVCKSSDNKSNKLKNLYVIIYPYLQYYKVVVANLVITTDDIDNATFIYNW